MKVYVVWNPMYEEVVCVHAARDRVCEKCRLSPDSIARDPNLHVEEFEVAFDEGILVHSNNVCDYCERKGSHVCPNCCEYDEFSGKELYGVKTPPDVPERP
jgi:hypothetical protein